MAFKIHTGDREKDKIYQALSNYKFKDLQGAAIKRGMPFDDVINGTYPKLSSWIMLHWDVPLDKSLLKEFDMYVDGILKERGYKKKDPMRKYKKFEPEYTQEEAAEQRAKEKALKPKVEKVKKPKKKKDEKFGIFEGTKKEYTYILTQKVYNKFFGKYKDTNKLVKKFSTQLYVKVKKKFPEANEKSIKIWMKRAIESIHASATKNKAK